MSLFTESAYNVETKTIAVDYGHIDIYPKIEKGLAGLEIGVLGKYLVSNPNLKVVGKPTRTQLSFTIPCQCCFETSFIWPHLLKVILLLFT